MHLTGVHLIGVHLIGVHLTGVHLIDVPFSWASLTSLFLGYVAASAPKPVSSASTRELVSPVPPSQSLPAPASAPAPAPAPAPEPRCSKGTLFVPGRYAVLAGCSPAGASAGGGNV